MYANILSISFAFLAWCCLLPILDAIAIFNADVSNGQGSQASASLVGRSDRVIPGRDGLTQWSEMTSNTLTTTSLALWPRSIPFANHITGGRMNWDAVVAITPSIYAAHAFITMFTMLYNIVLDSWSRQPPREKFEVRYGSLRLSLLRADEVIPWVFIADLARKMTDAVKRGLFAFLRVTFEFAKAAPIVFTIMCAGMIIHGITGPPRRPEPPRTFDIEE